MENKLSNDRKPIKKHLFLMMLILAILSASSFIAYQYHIALYLIFFLVPLYINEKISVIKNLHFEGVILSIVTWLALNAYILTIKQALVTSSLVGTYVAISNTLVFAWMNIIIYFYCFYNVYILLKKNKNIEVFFSVNKYNLLFIVTSIIINVAVFISLYKSVDASVYLYAVIFLLLYTFLLRGIVTKQLGIYINFLISSSSIVTVISGIIIVFFIIQKLYSPEDEMRGGCSVSVTFLSYFNIAGISSILLYLLPNKEKNNNKYVCLFLMFLLVSVGIIFQFNYLKFLFY